MSEFTPYVCMQTNSKCYKQTVKMTPVGILWHSTGANNPWLKRYVQPADNSANKNADLNKLGKNTYKNDYNHASLNEGLNAFIGKFADGTVGTVQTMPWDYQPWGCGKGSKGSCNSGWIQFEICEDALKDKEYAQKVYDEAVALTAFLCKKYKLDPLGFVTKNGVKVPVLTCHNDASKLGFASSHSDINHWFPSLLGKNMENVRQDVAAALGQDGESPANGAKPTTSSDSTSKPATSTTTSSIPVASTSYKVKITASVLNVRKGPGTSNAISTTVKKGEVYTITEEKSGWGKLKSGAGWIMLKYTQKV